MTVIDIRLKYSRTTGNSLDAVKTFAEFPDSFPNASAEYIKWLEKELEQLWNEQNNQPEI